MTLENNLALIPLASNEAKGYYMEGVGGYELIVIGALGVINRQLETLIFWVIMRQFN